MQPTGIYKKYVHILLSLQFVTLLIIALYKLLRKEGDYFNCLL